jgi:hypothetical protein
MSDLTLKENIVHALMHARKTPIELNSEEGFSALVLPFGARLLGLFPSHASNLLWANPLLERSDTALQFLQTAGWRNTGGGRTWISPERDIHVVDLEDPWKSYRPTESIDPGTYSSIVADGRVQLKTSGTVTNHRTAAQCSVALEKTFRLIPNPLRRHPGASDLLDEIRYAGVEQNVTLTYADMSPDQFPLSLWDAVNLPARGTLIVPTAGKIVPTDFFEPTSSSHLKCTSHGVRFVFDGLQRHKIAIRATDLLSGRAGYLRQINRDEVSLVVRNFFLNPSGEYVDTPWDNSEDRGYVLECYNDGGTNGAFGELEYHSRAMGPGTGYSDCCDCAQLWGFQGPENKIRGIMSLLLGGALTQEVDW